MAGYLEGKRVRVATVDRSTTATGLVVSIEGAFILILQDDGSCMPFSLFARAWLEILEPETTKPDLGVDAFGMGESTDMGSLSGYFR